jgi:DNA helicase HerA-like ATPase
VELQSGRTSTAIAADQALGLVTAINGSQARILLRSGLADGEPVRATVGKFLGIGTMTSLVIGVITSVASQRPGVAGEPSTAEVDLLGEIKFDGERGPYFQRGVTEYPVVGDAVRPIEHDELRLIYDIAGPNTIDIGQLQQDTSIGAYINVDQMLRKHFAVLGTTGVGKSSGVALILRQILAARPDQRIFLIDPHNEYGRCFDGRAQVLNPRNLKLPFWLFNYEETVDVFFRGRPGVEEEVEILSEVIPIAKGMFAQERSDRVTIRKPDAKGTGFTVDTPVPYRLQDLVALIDERMGKLENRSSWMKYNRLITRIETVRNDPRYGFMFDNANVGGDTMVEVISQLFRLPLEGRPMTIMQLAGFPAEVVDSVVSVLCRMAFDFGLWSDGAVPVLFVCEEAHRYAPADRTIGFGPTRKAVSRIAKEGRKYGVYLGLVTQRPAELDPTIVSQCSTVFAMRMANDRDQAIVRSAVSDAAASLLAFVPSLGIREVFAFGEGVALPTRLKFGELPPHLLPKSEAVSSSRLDPAMGVSPDFIASVVERWRGATMSQKLKLDENAQDFEGLGIDEFAPVTQPHGLDPERYDLLKKPGSDAPAFAPAAAGILRVPSPTVAGREYDAGARLPPPEPAAAPGNGRQAFSADLQDLRRRLTTRGT